MAKKITREAEEGSQLLSDVLTQNIRDSRSLRHLSQTDVAESMRLLGHDWSRVTVSEVEHGGREIKANELVALAFVLKRRIVELYDPTGIEGKGTFDLDFGGEIARMKFPAQLIREWLRGDDVSIEFANGTFGIQYGSSASAFIAFEALRQQIEAHKAESG